MTRPPTPGARSILLLEYALMLAVLASVGWVIAFYREWHYLPQPFIFDTFDTFMDWFNTAFWANRSGAYSVWHSVYPPLSFVFLNIFSDHSCYTSPMTARDCDMIGIATILFFYALSALLACLCFWRANRATALPRSVAFALGFPMLFCLERGNLVLVCLVPFILAYGNLAVPRFWRWVSIGLTINFKPYLVLPSLALGVKREWRALEGAALLTIAIYLLTLIYVGSGSPMQLFENTGIWVKFNSGQFWEQSYFSTSYATLLMVNESPFPILRYVSSETVELLNRIIPMVIRISQIAALAALIAAWLQPRAVDLARIAALLMAVHLITQSPGGYTLAFLLFLVFLDQSRRVGPTIALVCGYALALSYDRVVATVMDTNPTSWLSGMMVSAKFGLAIGQMVRPGLLLLILWALALDTIAEVIRAHRRNRPSLRLVPA
jgi:hypothetical protein